MIPPYAKLQYTVNGGATQTGGHTVAASATVQLSADPAGLLSRWRYEISDYPPGFPQPAGADWATDSTTGAYYSTLQTPSPITLGDLTQWGKYLFRLLGNGGDPGVYRNVIPAAQLDDRSSGVQVLGPNGSQDVAAGESNQFDPQRQWVGALKSALRKVDAGTSSTFAVATIVNSNVASLGAWNVSNDSYTAVAGDLVALRAQTTVAQNAVYTVGTVVAGVAPLTLAATQPPAGSILLVKNGFLFHDTLWRVDTNAFTPIQAPDDVVNGTYGARLELASDAPGYTKLELFGRRFQQVVTIAPSATVTVFTFDSNAEGFMAATSRFSAAIDCNFFWASGGVPGGIRAYATGTLGATVALDTNLPTIGITGTSTDTSPAWVASGATLLFQITNNRAQTMTVAAMADGYAYTI